MAQVGEKEVVVACSPATQEDVQFDAMVKTSLSSQPRSLVFALAFPKFANVCGKDLLVQRDYIPTMVGCQQSGTVSWVLRD